MTKQPPQLKSPSQVMGTAMDGEFSAVGGWKEGCFVTNMEWEGKKEHGYHVFRYTIGFILE